MKFNSYNSYRKQFSKLVESERKEEMRRHFHEIENLSGEKREKLGRAIQGLSGKDGGRGLGGTYLVKFGRGKEISRTQISVGDLVIVSQGRPNGKEPQATVTEMTSYSLTVAFNNKPPSYVYKKSLRLDLFANDITFQRMFSALKNLEHNSPVKKALMGKISPGFDNKSKIERLFNSNLNDSQENSVEKCLQAKDFHLLHGPPGTGKTTTLVEVALQHLKRNNKILITADSNVAVDNVVEKLSGYYASVLRIGNPARLNKNVVEHSLDYRLQYSGMYNQAIEKWKYIESMREKQKNYTKPTPANRRGFKDEEIKKLSESNKSSRGLSSKQLRLMAKWLEYQDEISSVVENAKKMEEDAVQEIMRESDIIVTTNSSAGSEVMETYLEKEKKNFDLVLVDEASQSVEPATVIPLTKGEKFVLAGDHKQLPPTVLSRNAEDLQHSLFERLTQDYTDQVKSTLTIQYRMLPAIMNFSNDYFYEGKLQASDSAKQQKISSLYGKTDTEESSAWLKDVLSEREEFLFLDTKNLEERYENLPKGSTSYKNFKEAEYVEHVVRKLLEKGVSATSIGVISPYDNQADLINSMLKDNEEIEVKTVDGFQGREKEVIVISFARSNNNGNIGFLTDKRRLNVAVTRAKKKLIMVGDSSTLASEDTYNKLLGYSRNITL